MTMMKKTHEKVETEKAKERIGMMGFQPLGKRKKLLCPN